MHELRKTVYPQALQTNLQKMSRAILKLTTTRLEYKFKPIILTLIGILQIATAVSNLNTENLLDLL
jgi:hypothetical protein